MASNQGGAKAKPKPKTGRHMHTCTGTHEFTVTGVHRETTFMHVKWLEITALPAKGSAACKFWVRPSWLMHESGPMPKGDQALCTIKDGLAEPPCEPPCPALEGVTVCVQGERHNPWFAATATEFKEIQARITASTRPRPAKRAAANMSEPGTSQQRVRLYQGHAPPRPTLAARVTGPAVGGSQRLIRVTR